MKYLIGSILLLILLFFLANPVGSDDVIDDIDAADSATSTQFISLTNPELLELNNANLDPTIMFLLILGFIGLIVASRKSP